VASRLLHACLLWVTVGCGSSTRFFPNADPLWRDPDQRPFERQPEEYESPFAWDAANQTVFRPVSRFFAVDPAGEAVNVNALDEVPDSSWFENRIGRFGMTPQAAAQGPCTSPLPDRKGPWVIKGAKPNGFNPGFFIKANDGKRYLVKFDGVVEGMRPTAADVIGTRLFHAAGYFVPCNRIAYFDRSILKIDPDAKSENERGEKVKLEEAALDQVFSKALRLADGRYRASMSLFVEGKPLGPWTYEGRRADDPNDVVAHEDRRELRGLEVMAAWLAWFDTREQNTMATWVNDGKSGHVRHYLLDVGNAYGSIWEPPMMGRRIGHSYYLDFPHVLEDFLTLGAIERPWDRARFGRTGKVFSYYRVEDFDPDAFRPGYPNPAFVRKSERDAAWMARIVARLSDAHLRAIVKTGLLLPEHESRLLEVLIGRRDKVLRRYLERLSPLAWPEARGPELCLEDLALGAGLTPRGARRYAARAWVGTALTPAPLGATRWADRHSICTHLPDAPVGSPLLVDVTAATSDGRSTFPARVHLHSLGEGRYRVVGLERPDSHDPPS